MAQQKKNEKFPTNEEIIAALLDAGSIAEAAQKLGISVKTIYERRRDSDFRLAYQDAKNEIIRGAVYKINRSLSDAVDTVTEIMNDTNVNPQTRLQAAQTLISNSTKITERLEKDELSSRTMQDPWDIMGA